MTKLSWIVVIGCWLIPPGLLVMKLWMDHSRHKRWKNDRLAELKGSIEALANKGVRR